MSLSQVFLESDPRVLAVAGGVVRLVLGLLNLVFTYSLWILTGRSDLPEPVPSSW